VGGGINTLGARHIIVVMIIIAPIASTNHDIHGNGFNHIVKIEIIVPLEIPDKAAIGIPLVIRNGTERKTVVKRIPPEVLKKISKYP